MDTSVTPLHDHLVRRLAEEFFRNLGELLMPDEVTALLQRHQHYPTEPSDSPEVTPAALALTQAFKTVMRRLPRLSLAADVALLSASWNRIRALNPVAHTESSFSQVALDVSVPEGRVRTLYPSTYIWHTGGGCLAMRLDCADAGYLLMTDAEDPCVPEPDATEVMLGRYAANGDLVDEAAIVALSDLKRAIDAALRRASTPTNVADYFVKTLGAGDLGPTLHEIALASRCGQDCTGVIDSAAALIERCRRIRGEKRPVLEEHAIEIARRLIRHICRSYGK